MNPTVPPDPATTPPPAERERLLARFKKMFGCDTARISQPCGKLFLVIGWNRNTRDDAGQWYKNGVPVDFDYVREKVIASGTTVRELMKSAREYKRLSGMTWADYFRAAADELSSVDSL